MEWANGKEDPATAEWKDASKGAIFNYQLWEPGYVEVRHVKIENKGDLALKYNVTIHANGEPSELAKVIDVYSIDPAVQITDRKALTDNYKVGTLNDVIANMSTTAVGDLLKNESDTLTIALKMQESAGNEYQNMSIGSDFSITLTATQLSHEEDSFNNQYDANTWSDVAEPPVVTPEGTVTVYTAEQLAGVMADTSNIKTIEIMADIDLGGRDWKPANTFSNTKLQLINGNGHTISNMHVEGDSKVGFIGSNARSLTIRDLTFKNANVKGSSFVGVVCGYMYGNPVLENVDVVDSVVSSYYDETSKGIRAGALIGFIPPDGGVVTLKNCDVTGSTISGYHNVGAMIGTTYNSNAVVDNCTAKNNTIYYGSAQQGGFAFGAGNSGDNEYSPASGFIAENNAIIPVPADLSSTEAAINSGVDTLVLAPNASITLPANLNNVKTINANGAAIRFGGTIASAIAVNDAVIESDVKISSEVDATFNSCHFTGDNGINYTYCKNAVFENCVFDCTEKAIHFDVVGESITVKNCQFNKGKVQIGGYTSKATFEDCTFGGTASTSIWSEKGMRFYIPTTFTNCEFNNRVVLAGSNGLSLTFVSCTVNSGTPLATSDQIIKGGNVPTVTIK